MEFTSRSGPEWEHSVFNLSATVKLVAILDFHGNRGIDVIRREAFTTVHAVDPITGEM